MKTNCKTKNMNRIWTGIGIAMVVLLLSGGIVSAATSLTIPYIAVNDQNWNVKKIFNTGDEARFVLYVNNPSAFPDPVTLKYSVIGGNGYTLLSSSPWSVTIPGKSTPGYAQFVKIPDNAPTGIYYYRGTASDSQGSVTGYAVFQIQNSGTSTIPAAPTGLAVGAVDGASIRLSWQDKSNNEAGFEISNGDTNIKVGANTNSYTWGGLTPGKYMCFHVRSYNAAGSSAWTPYACTTTIKQTTTVRDGIISRAKSWVDAQVPYSKYPPYRDGYRRDCSGFVGYAWQIKNNGQPYSPDTVALGSTYGIDIPFNTLQPGDIINNKRPGDYGHTVIFVNWLDQSHTKFVAYEENRGYGKAVRTELTLVTTSNGVTIKEYNANAPGPYYAQTYRTAPTS